MESNLDRESIAAQVAAFPYWYHRIELPQGVVTPGWAPLDMASYGIPQRLDGKRVLDVGAWDGFWSFEALKRGAAEVVAIDDFSDFLGRLQNDQRKAWETFDLCRSLLGYDETRCRRTEMTVYDISEERLGRFDVVFFFGTIYRLRHPLLALDRLSAVCDGEIFVESAILDDFSPYRGGLGYGYPYGEMVAEFYPRNEYGNNNTNWWVPTVDCLTGMLQAAGFENCRGWKLTQQPSELAHCRGFSYGQKLSGRNENARLSERRENPIEQQDRFGNASQLQDKFQQALALHQRGMLAEAEKIYEEILRQQPNHFDALHLSGVIALQMNRAERCVALVEKAIAIDSRVPAAHSNLGAGLVALNRFDEAIASYDEAIALQPDYAEAHKNRGNALRELRRFEDALDDYETLIALTPDQAEAHNNRGTALGDLRRYEEALLSYDRAIALKPDYAEAHNNRGLTLAALHRYEKALLDYDKAIALKPDYAEAYSNRGSAMISLRRYQEALGSFDRAIALKPDYAEAYSNRGNAMISLRRYQEALGSFDRAIALKSDFAEAYSNRGNAMISLRRYQEALDSFDRAIVLKPDYTEAYGNLANALHALKRHDHAAMAYEKVLEIDPEYPFVKGNLLHEKMLLCDWRDIDRQIEEIAHDLTLGRRSSIPFGWQAAAKSELLLKICAEIYNHEIFPASVFDKAPFMTRNSERIRVGYLSGEFREHPASLLMVGVFENHDHSRFEVFAFDNGWGDHSETRRRINSSVHRIFNIRDLSDAQAAAAIRENQIDILIDLNGYCDEGRTAVLAQRPAPIQVNYLGFPGTLGSTYMDYIVADKYLIPEENRIFYNEKIIYMPDCYQANDRKKQISTKVISRSECGLPEQGTVFCCFNNNFKIIPEVFDVWMRILQKVEGSVLWLRELNTAASFNLRKEAMARGVNAERLIFAQGVSLPEHLARQRCADLLLDTLPFNAHTIASDALWAGLPVLTCLGQTFAGRVAASMLNAIQLPELITTTLEDYEYLAIDLGTNTEKLLRIKLRLNNNILTTPLFDTSVFTKHLEFSYVKIHERYKLGLPPDHIIVPTT